MRPPAPRLPCVWVVASHRELANEHGHPQCYTVMDEAGTHPAYGRIIATYVNACYAHRSRREQGGDGPRPAATALVSG